MITALVSRQKQHSQCFPCQFGGTSPRGSSYMYSSVLEFSKDRGYFTVEREVLSTPALSEWLVNLAVQRKQWGESHRSTSWLTTSPLRLSGGEICVYWVLFVSSPKWKIRHLMKCDVRTYIYPQIPKCITTPNISSLIKIIIKKCRYSRSKATSRGNASGLFGETVR